MLAAVIVKSAKTGKIGDGNFFVSPVKACCAFATGKPVSRRFDDVVVRHKKCMGMLILLAGRLL